MKVVLFDIDGTLLWSDGAGRRAVQQALEEVFGTAIPEGHEFDGKTDPQIVRELMIRAGLDDTTITERLPRALDRYLGLLQAELARIDDTNHLFPGIPEVLDALEQRDDVLLGLLTGNIQPGAHAKLRAVGLDPDRFKVGAFGSDHASRPELPAVARARAETLLGHAVAGEDVIVIGDTPADMSCGNGIGARAIGVATGRYSLQQLTDCAEGVVFENLADTAAVVQAILGDAHA